MAANNVIEVSSGAASPNSMMGTFISLAVAMVVLRFEIQRRTADGTTLGLHGSYSPVATCKRVLCQWAPEMTGLMACLSLAALLRARGDLSGNDGEAWEQIKAEWPLLMTADTLLALQAMLRLTTLLSALLRAENCLPLGDEAAALWFHATVARVVLSARTTAYQLEGPLGGTLPVALELATLPILMVLGRSAMRKAPFMGFCVCVLVGCMARRHYLALAEDTFSNLLFVSAHFLDLLAGCAYLFRTALSDNGSSGAGSAVSVGFAHVLMPLQQSLSAYFFYTAFDEAADLIGAGAPFKLLALGNMVLLGCYVGAAALYFTERLGSGPVPEVAAPGMFNAMARAAERTPTNADAPRGAF